jgi:hypothetical protein
MNTSTAIPKEKHQAMETVNEHIHGDTKGKTSGHGNSHTSTAIPAAAGGTIFPWLPAMETTRSSIRRRVSSCCVPAAMETSGVLFLGCVRCTRGDI